MTSLAGSFLVARPVLNDPNFKQSVVMILGHGDGGAYGVVVNRPVPLSGLPLPLFEGGPCEGPGLVMLHGHPEWVNTTDDGPGPGVAPGIFLGDTTCLSRVEDLESDSLRFRMFSGYAGWGPDQLERELTAGAWIVVPATAELLFDTPVEDLWDRLSPPTTPQPSVN